MSLWQELKEAANPLLHMEQAANDIVYFGIHDIGRMYRQIGNLPELLLAEIQSKTGEILNSDPIRQTITVGISQKLHNMGYRQMSHAVQTTRTGQMFVKLPKSSLLNINHMILDRGSRNVWLAIDDNTTFQKEIIRRIRAKEASRSQQSEPEVPATQIKPPILNRNRYWKPSNEPTKQYDYIPAS